MNTGGGYQFGSARHIILMQNRPASGQGWSLGVYNASGTVRPVHVYAVCASVSGRQPV